MSDWRIIIETAGFLAFAVGLWWISPAWCLVVCGGVVVLAGIHRRLTGEKDGNA